MPLRRARDVVTVSMGTVTVTAGPDGKPNTADSGITDCRDMGMVELATLCRRCEVRAEKKGPYILIGKIRGKRRKADAIQSRDAIVLDMDFGHEGWLETARAAWRDFEFLAYTTFSHTPGAPRARFIFPLTRPVAPDEYGPIGRRLALRFGIDGMDAFGAESYSAAQAMFLPARAAADGDFIAEHHPGEWVEPDAILAQYGPGLAWRDIRNWPLSSRELRPHGSGKGEDPRGKPGIIGAVCRAYTCRDIIDNHLSQLFRPSESDPNRYHLVGHKERNGVQLLDDDRKVHIWHGSAPFGGEGGRQWNAFDLLRVGLFDDKDKHCREKITTKFAEGGAEWRLALEQMRGVWRV
jgi:putative DNA primase/helicase